MDREGVEKNEGEEGQRERGEGGRERKGGRGEGRDNKIRE